MYTMLRKLLFTVCAIFSLLFSSAQSDSTKVLTISGNVDAYYRYNFAGHQSATNNYTSFTNSNKSFELGMASIRADLLAVSGKVGGTVDLGFGRRAEEFSYNDGESNSGKNGFVSLSNIKQAFVTYAPSTAIKFTMGKFATHVGYELLDAPLNRNYSMSYMFTNGPFFHTGLKADITAGKIGLMVGIANHVDQTTASNQVKNVIGQISSTTSDKIKLYLNYWGYFGDESQATGAISKSQFDVVVLGTISDKFNIGYNGTVQSWKYY